MRCCGVCRTDLHLAEGDLPPHHPRTTPGHEVVGRRGRARRRRDPVRARRAHRRRRGSAAPTAPAGSAGAGRRTCAWRRRSPAGTCDGGYAEACVVDEAYAYRLPDVVRRRAGGAAAVRRHHRLPRAARRAAVPPGGRLGIYGFGGSAHLTAQVALHQGMRVHVLTRGEGNRRLATELGADSVGDAADAPPEPLDGGDPVRPGRRAGPGRAARARPRRHARGRRDLAVRHPGAELRGRAVRGAAAAQRHGEHPARTARSSCGWRTGTASARRRSPTRSRTPTRRSPTSPRGRFSGAAVLHMT